jgi:hypothetical protein
MIARVAWIVLLSAAVVLGGCSGSATTEINSAPFNRFTIQNVRDAFSRAGLPVQVLVRDIFPGRDEPRTFNDRYIFPITRIAPAGGQVVFFTSQPAMDAWLGYMEELRADSERRRDVVYVYTHGNIMLQLNADLLPEEAAAFEQALASLG